MEGGDTRLATTSSSETSLPRSTPDGNLVKSPESCKLSVSAPERSVGTWSPPRQAGSASWGTLQAARENSR